MAVLRANITSTKLQTYRGCGTELCSSSLHILAAATILKIGTLNLSGI